MELDLNPIETRVLGSLIEKDLTTPDYYPMTLAALTAACNQKSNRDPVLKLSEVQVMDALDSLTHKYLAWEKGGAGGRVPRYAHKLSGTLSKTFDFSRRELGVLGVLMLRGPQTPGELRTRAPRTCEFHGLDEVEETLKGLAGREPAPFAAELPKEPGRRERRWAHLFGPIPEPATAALPEAPQDAELEQRVTVLEQQVATLSAELAALKEALGQE